MHEQLLLRTLSWGTLRGHVLVLLHGLYGSGRGWHPLASAWRARGGYALAMDLRNHGGSPHAPTQRVHEMARDAVHTLSTLHGSRALTVTLVGHSMGGQVAQAMSTICSECGWLLRGVVLLDSLVLGEALPDRLREMHVGWYAALLSEAARRSASREETCRRLATKMPEHIARFLVTNYVRDGHTGLYHWRLGLVGIGDYLHGGADLAMPIGCDAPLWLVRGAHSPYTRHLDAAGLKRVAPRSRLVTVRGSGDPHYPHHMDLQRVMHLLESL